MKSVNLSTADAVDLKEKAERLEDWLRRLDEIRASGSEREFYRNSLRLIRIELDRRGVKS